MPYVLSDADQVVNSILALEPRPHALRVTRYFHTVSPMAITPRKEVCMTIFLIQKGHAGIAGTELELSDLPLDVSIDPGLL